MQTYQDNDNKFVLLRKILQNQFEQASSSVTSFAAITAQIADVYNQVVALLAATKPSLSGITTGPDLVIAVAGTAVQGPNIIANRGVLVVARQDNTGNMYVGGANVSKGSGTHKGIILSQLGMPSTIVPVSNADQIYVNGDNANDSVGLIIL